MEDKDIKLIQYSLLKINEKNATLNDKFIKEFSDVIGKLFRAYKQDEKVIEEMANCIATNDSNLCQYLDITNKCKYYAGENKNICDKCIIDYFRKKCE